MDIAVIVINCVCSVISVVITMLSIGARLLKNSITKEDLEPIKAKLNDLENKMDRQEHAQSDMRERMAIVEFRLGIDHYKEGGRDYEYIRSVQGHMD